MLSIASPPKVTKASMEGALRGIYTGEKTLHIVAVASNGDLKRWEDFY